MHFPLLLVSCYALQKEQVIIETGKLKLSSPNA